MYKLAPFTLILASQSPRRKQLIEMLGFSVKVRIPSANESFIPKTVSPKEIPEYLAKIKADIFPATELQSDEILITADTLVFSGNTPIGKPKDEQEATTFLKQLSGKKHTVITGVCLKTNHREICFSETTHVCFRELSDDEIQYYISVYKPFDKAGAYGIQEWIGFIGVESIEGCFYNVMGLPTQKVFSELKKIMGKPLLIS